MIIKKLFFKKLLGIFILVFFLILFTEVSVFKAHASNITSPSFMIKDPIIGTSGGYGTSASFQLNSSGNTVLSGYSSSASFINKYGFLYYSDTVPTITFSISANTVNFGNLSSSGPRYATTSSGSGTNVVAHTISASSNATSGYMLTYKGSTLTNGANTISPATISADADGTTGASQFAISLSSSGSATIPSAYNQSGPNWKFLANTTDTIATTSGSTSSETFSVRYLSNILLTDAAGSYSSSITYIITGNF